MSQLMQSRMRDNGCQSFWHCLAAEVRRIACCAPALPVALLVILLLSAGVGRAQTPITYETTPRDTLGETMWTIDLSGPMTPSQDGTKFLVVNAADAMFYVVDVATGTHRKITSAPQVINREGPNFTASSFNVDSDLRWLFFSRRYRPFPDAPYNNHMIAIVDLIADSVVYTVDSAGIPMSAISSKHQRGVHPGKLYELPTYKELATFQNELQSTWWFDDAHGLLYRSRNVGVDEYDAVTGRFIRSHGPFWNAEATVARRAPGSPWLYVVTTRMRDGYAPYVVAIHTETKEQRYFDAFAGSRQNIVRFTDESIQQLALDDGRLIICGNVGVRYPVWMFDAEGARSTAICDASFRIFGETLGLPTYVSATSGTCIHNEPKVGDETPWVIRHRRLVPRASVSVAGDTGLVIPSWFRQWPDRIAVVMPAGTVDECVVVGSDGREALRVPQGRLQASPIELPTLGLASGMYICRVRTAGEWRSQSFMVVK